MTVDELEHEVALALSGTPAARWPSAAPRDPIIAARWLLRLLEPQQREEQPQQRTQRDGSSVTIWPYGTRVLHQARRFLSLPEGVQQFIIAAAQDEIHWRGEDIESFQRVAQNARALRTAGRDVFVHAVRERSGL